MSPKLFFSNIPYNCSDQEFRDWVESRGLETRAIRVIRDLVSGASPAFGYVELKDQARLKEAVSLLNGRQIRNQKVEVSVAKASAMTAGITFRKTA